MKLSIRCRYFSSIYFLLFSITCFAQNVNSDRAREKYFQGAFEEALQLANEVIAAEPQNFEAWLIKADCLQKQEEIQSSILAYNTAEKLNSQSALLAINYGSALISARQYKRALEKLEQAIKLDPTNAAAHYYAGNATYFLYKHNQALRFYEKAVELNPKYKEAYYMMAATYAEQQKYGEALGFYEKTLTLDPDLAEARYNMAVIYFANQEYEAADKLFGTLTEVPNVAAADYYFYRAETSYYSGRREAACEDYKKSMELGDADAAEIYRKYCLENVPREELKHSKTIRMAF